jgi:5-hydroxyisourate hydrolase
VTISTHVLDTAAGRPAPAVAVRLEHREGAIWRVLAELSTDHDGRVPAMVPADAAPGAGDYKLIFETGAYFSARGVETFYPRAVVEFTVREPAAHYHVPLLISPFGYSTYRGS